MKCEGSAKQARIHSVHFGEADTSALVECFAVVITAALIFRNKNITMEEQMQAIQNHGTNCETPRGRQLLKRSARLT